jgi:hypothetical protein
MKPQEEHIEQSSRHVYAGEAWEHSLHKGLPNTKLHMKSGTVANLWLEIIFKESRRL